MAELDAAGLEDPDEDDRLSDEEDLLADAVAHRDAAAAAVEVISGDGGVVEALGGAIGALAGRAPFAAFEARLPHGRRRTRATSLVMCACWAKGSTTTRPVSMLCAVGGSCSVISSASTASGPRTSWRTPPTPGPGWPSWCRTTSGRPPSTPSAWLRSRASRTAARVVGRARRAAAPGLAAAAQAHLADLAMASARLGVEVGEEDPGDVVTFLLAANAGAPLLPLTKVASGGELARAMLALRLVLARVDDVTGPATLIFDEVDAGVGGQAATAVGRALAELAHTRQVLVVTHLPQVAAFADTHVAVTKHDDGRTTEASVRVLDDEERVVELSRMLSGSPESATAHDHAAELMAAAARDRKGGAEMQAQRRRRVRQLARRRWVWGAAPGRQ